MKLSKESPKRKLLTKNNSTRKRKRKINIRTKQKIANIKIIQRKPTDITLMTKKSVRERVNINPMRNLNMTKKTSMSAKKTSTSAKKENIVKVKKTSTKTRKKISWSRYPI